MKKIIYAMTFAGICAVGANADITPKTPSVEGGCYQIGTVEELYGFAAVVNGTNGQTANKTACGKLTADIKANESNVHVSEGGNLIAKECSKTGALGTCSQYADRPLESWTPIKGFSGVFDGGNHTISSLYYIAPSTSEAVNVDAGFFASVTGGAVIKNLNIRDSYFRALNRIGGIVADIQAVNTDKMVVIDNCSFGGTVAGGVKTLAILPDTHGNNIGGLVGSVGQNVKLTISNSYNTGRVLSSNLNDNTGVETEIAGAHFGGLVGLLQSGADVKIYNSYNTGYVGGDKSFLGIQYGPYSALVARSNGEPTPAYDGVYCSNENKGAVTDCAAASANYKAAADIPTAYAAYDQSKIQAVYSADADVLGKMLALDPNYVPMAGVSISYDDGVVATIHDDATTFSIPQDIKVDKVVFTRQFTAEGYSTITLPFSIESSKINEGANTFAKLKEVKEEDGVFTDAVGEPTTSLEAYTPYLLTINSAELLVSGAVTLKKTPESATTTVGDWSFIGTMAKKRWQDDDENADELGRVYGFAGSANKNNLAIGSFVKAGNKVAILPLRAYLIYNGSEPEKKPAAPGAEYAPAAVASIDKLPESMRVIIVDPAPADTDEDDNQITAIKNLKAPANIVKSDRWHDVTGRSMNKPKAQGAYVNYRTPVIVK